MAVLMVVVAVAVGGCSSAGTAKLPRLGVDFAFADKNKCRGLSPEIRLSNVPAGVTSYEIEMTDFDAPSFRHWNETLPARGTTIPAGASKQYYGPCPPSGTHRYQIAVTARDPQGKPVAYGDKVVVTGR